MIQHLWPYMSVLFTLVACSLGLPLPEDVPLLTSGFLCHKGLANLYIMIPVAMVGVLGGDFLLFYLGRQFGHRIVEHRIIRRLVHPSRLLTAERLFAEHGIKIIFVGRFLPGLRPMIFVASGVLKIEFWKFALVNGLAACISVPTLVLLGNLFGYNLEWIQSEVRTAMHYLLLTVLIAGLIVGTFYFHRRQRRMMESAGVPKGIDAETLSHMPPATRQAQSEPVTKPRADS